MPARTPEEVHHHWVAAMNAGDLEAVLATYEPEASALLAPGQVITGTAALREALNGFLALTPRFDLAVKQVIPAGDLALLLSPWTMTGTGPDGAVMHLAGTATDVVRRQADGTWRTVIDNPFGTAFVVPAA